MNKKVEKKVKTRVTNKRRHILRAAEKEFAQKGLAGARMDSIARAAGLDKATLYHYFSTKKDIYDAVLQDLIEALNEMSDMGMAMSPDPGGELPEFVDALIDLLNKHRSFALIFRREFTESSQFHKGAIMNALSPLIQQSRDFMEGRIARGEMRPVDPEHALFSIFEVLSGYFSITPKIAGMFFDESPYSQEMLERRKTHVVDVIRRLLVPDDPPQG